MAGLLPLGVGALAIGAAALWSRRGSRATKIVQYDLWRKPDLVYGSRRWGTSLWWGPEDNPEDCDTFVEVSGNSVTEYNFIPGEEGRQDCWSMRVYVVGEDDLAGRRALPRIVAGIGVEKIGEGYGDEEQLDNLPFDVANLRRVRRR